MSARVLIAAAFMALTAPANAQTVNSSHLKAASQTLSTSNVVNVRPLARPVRQADPAILAAINAAVRPNARLENLPRTRWDNLPRGRIWTRAALSALVAHGGGLDAFVPEDIAEWCPAYVDAAPAQRRAFWVGMFSALAFHESTWNPRAVGGGNQWFGLLQIFPPTAQHYRCRARSGNALMNGAENLSCAVRIASYEVQMRGTVTRGMRAWGPFHSASKRAQMSAWTRGQSYCRPIESVRPQSRPITLRTAFLIEE